MFCLQKNESSQTLTNTVGSSILAGTGTMPHVFKSSSISASANAIRHRIYNISFNNNTAFLDARRHDSLVFIQTETLIFLSAGQFIKFKK